VAKGKAPAVFVAGDRSAVVVALHDDSRGADDAVHDPLRGIVAPYARGDDYHELRKERLIALQEWIGRERVPVSGRACVGYRRGAGARAGAAGGDRSTGKNTMSSTRAAARTSSPARCRRTWSWSARVRGRLTGPRTS
jgi:Domain of unknown function (DUF1730)